MATLEGLLIQGIRSFGPEKKHRQVIHFNSPLTLILGRNGCGKTTIIEALKFATIGEYPFGQGQAFIHDPKINREVEVKGQIKLEFNSIQKKRLTVTRNLQGTQKAKKLEVCSIDNTIESQDPVTGEKVNISSRCADITELMVDSLGVSKSIISNVIFCHQEDSNWPLEEGKKLKERFDDIFESGGHNKCLEDIRQKRKLTVEELKRMRLELLHLKEKRDTARTKRLQLQDEMKRYEDMLVEVEETKMKEAALQNDWETLNQKNINHGEILSEIGKKKAQLDSLVEQQNELLNNLKEVFDGSDENLKVAINDFKMKMRDKDASLQRCENEIRRLKEKDDEYLKQTSMEMNKMGGLKVEINLQEQRIKERNEKLQILIEKCELSRLSDIPSESDVRQSLAEADEYMAEMNNRVEFTRNQHDEVEKRLQADLDAKRVTISQLQQEIKNKDATIRSTKDDIKEKQTSLAKVETCSKRLGEVEAEIERYRVELDRLKETVDVEDLNEQIKTKKETCVRLDERQRAVNEEVKALLVHSSNQNKLTELQKQQTSLSTTLRKLRNKHKEGIDRLLPNSREGSMNFDLGKVLHDLEDTINRDTKKISVQEQQINNLTLKRRLKKEQLAQLEEEVKVATEKIYELCGSKTLDAVIEEEEKKLSKLQDETGSLSSSETMFKNYIRKLEEVDPCCPLCQRNFDSNEDASMLIQELSSKISSVPSKRKENEAKIQTINKKLQQLLGMRPMSQRISDLQKRIIPATKSELSDFEMELDSLNQDLAVLQASIIVPQEDVTTARSMLSDVGVMDRLSNDLKGVEAEIERTKRLLPTGGLKRTIEEAQAENDLLRDELAETRRDREILESQLHKYRESLNNLEQKLNQKVTEQLEIKAMIQQRVQIEERLFELQMNEKTLESDRQVLRNKLVPANAEMEAAEELMRTTRATHRTQHEQLTKEASRKRTQLEQVLNLQSAVLNAEKKRFKERLEDVQRDIERLNKQRNDCKESISRTEAKLKVVIQEIADSKGAERNLQDNLLLRTKKEEAGRVETELHRLNDELKSLNIAHVRERLTDMATEVLDLRGRAHKCEGIAFTLKTNIGDKKQELNQDIYKRADENYKKKFIDVKIYELQETDLQKFYVAYDQAIMKYHGDKMEEINAIIKELWMRIYRGNDIDYIAIRTDAPPISVTAAVDKRRVYNYRVVQIKHETELDMRGRCSAGQKILSSLIIRMALAETFSLRCGILALDEPTSNLDDANIASLSDAILEIVTRRMRQDNFQLIVITHDAHFVRLLSQADFISDYYEVSRSNYGRSVIKKTPISELEH